MNFGFYLFGAFAAGFFALAGHALSQPTQNLVAIVAAVILGCESLCSLRRAIKTQRTKETAELEKLWRYYQSIVQFLGHDLAVKEIKQQRAHIRNLMVAVEYMRVVCEHARGESPEDRARLQQAMSVGIETNAQLANLIPDYQRGSFWSDVSTLGAETKHAEGKKGKAF